jgi:hypothetical protein
MQEVPLYDSTREPRSWMEVIQPQQYAVFFRDVTSGAEMTGHGDYFHTGMVRSCLIFESLQEAEQYCKEHVEDIPNLRCDVFDGAGRANPAVATIVNSRHRDRVDSQAESKKLMRWGAVALAASLPLFWFAWTRRGEAWIAIFFGIQLIFAGLRLLHWGYSLKEELGYRQVQSNLRRRQITAMKVNR